MIEDELPEGWAEARLDDGLLTDVQSGFACGVHSRDSSGVSHLRPMNVTTEGQIALDDVKFILATEVDREERWIRRGDVLFNNTNSPELVGKTAYYGENRPRAFSNHMTRVRANRDAIDAEFLAMVLHQRWREGHFAAVCNNHVSQASISRSVLLDTELLVPPLAEQRRIVEKVETLLAQVNAARARLTKVPTILKRFRQSILSAACSGRLTEKLQPSSVDWASGTVDSACDDIVDCPHSTPRWSSTGHICLRTTNFTPRGLDLSEVRHVDRQTYLARMQRLRPRPGDVVYSREGGILGIACVLPDGLEACLGQRMMLMRPNPARMAARFLEIVLNSPETLAKVRELTGGTASPHLNVADIKAFEVPLPSMSEQHEIVRRVDALFKLADAIEARVAAATARADKLTQAILAKAFRGELVPTEADLARQEGRDYEPASALLPRIHAERAASEAAPKPAKPSQGRTGRHASSRVSSRGNRVHR